jgi:two-component system, cell cycle response regulator DivK
MLPPATTLRWTEQAQTMATVLIVDDQIELCAIHGAYLQKHGYRVLTAVTGEAALDSVRAQHPDVILLDHSLPGRTGVEVAQLLKADPQTADIPIVMVTAHPYGAIGRKARAAGCASFLSKPCMPRRILEEVLRFTKPVGGAARC